MFVAAVLFGVDFCRIRHECGGVLPVRVRQQGIMRGLGVVAVLVALRREFMEIGGLAMVVRCERMERGCGMFVMRRHAKLQSLEHSNRTRVGNARNASAR